MDIINGMAIRQNDRTWAEETKKEYDSQVPMRDTYPKLIPLIQQYRPEMYDGATNYAPMQGSDTIFH